LAIQADYQNPLMLGHSRRGVSAATVIAQTTDVVEKLCRAHRIHPCTPISGSPVIRPPPANGQEPVAAARHLEAYTLPMMFTKRLRDGVRRGEITCSLRIWTRPHVKVGGRYKMDEGEIEVDSIEPVGLPDITPELARASGFLGVVDLLKVANHGRGSNIYLVRFHYLRPRRKR
jgi:hypothetical protein